MKASPPFRQKNGGESGIRTRDTLLEYTRFPSVRLKPLGHLSTENNFSIIEVKNTPKEKRTKTLNTYQIFSVHISVKCKNWKKK